MWNTHRPLWLSTSMSTKSTTSIDTDDCKVRKLHRCGGCALVALDVSLRETKVEEHNAPTIGTAIALLEGASSEDRSFYQFPTAG